MASRKGSHCMARTRVVAEIDDLCRIVWADGESTATT
jgi:hypothetical protein